MTEHLTVPTHFGDLSELAAGLADRVDEERIILYGPQAFTEGATVAFSVLLVDGTPALEGYGRVAASVDGGEARAPETRYDIVFDELQLQGRSEVVYERIVLHRQSLMGGEPPTGQVDISELEEASDAQAEPGDAPAADEGGWAEPMDASAPDEGAWAEPGDASAADEGGWAGADEAFADEAFADETAEAAEAYEEVGEDVVSFATSEAPPAPEEGYEAGDELGADVDAVSPAEDAFADDFGGYEGEGEGATMVASIEELERAASAPEGQPAPQPPQAPEGFALPSPPSALTRPVHPPTWWPAEVPPPQPRASSGWFQSGGELPIPSEPPRPDLDPSQRVTPAPRPGAEATPNMPPRSADVASAEPEAAGHDAAELEAPDAGEPEAAGYDAAELEAPDAGESEAADLDADFVDLAAPDAEGLDETVEASLDPAGDPAAEFEVEGLDVDPVVPYDEDATAHEVSLPEADPFDER